MSETTRKLVTRRNFMKLAVVGAGTTAVGLYFLNKASEVDYSNPAYLYWRQDSQGAMNLARYLALCASLAPSPHNTQPWRFVTGENQMKVYADRSRNLGRGDADFRMLLMGMGAAIENISVAATHLGHEAGIETVAASEFRTSGLCANVTLSKQANPRAQDLFSCIFGRRTTRAPYLNEPVADGLKGGIDALNDSPLLAVRWFESPQDRQTVADLHAQAVRSFVISPAYQDTLNWWRYTRGEILGHRDGISIFTSCAPQMVKTYFQYGVDQKMMSGSSGQQGEVDFVDKLVGATPLWGAIVSSDTGDEARLRAGRLLERAYLEAERQGYKIMPMAYVSEQGPFSSRFKSAFNIPPEHELMTVFRVGKGEDCERSVRRPFSDVVSAA